MNTRGIRVPVGANLAPLRNDFAQALAQAERFRGQLTAKMAAVDAGKSGASAPRSDSGGTAGGPAGQMSEVGTQIESLAAQIGVSMQSAMAPLASFAARIAPQFDRVGATIITAFRRMDENAKFPRYQAWLTGARAQVQDFAAKSEGRIAHFANAADKALGGIQGIHRLRNLFINFGDVAGKTMGRLAGWRNPNLSFSSSTRSITNFYGATTAATNGLKGFASQAALALGVFGLGYKAVEWIKGGVSGAMHLNETIDKTRDVFGDATGSITKQADELSSKFGLPKQALLDASSAFGLMGKAAGLSGEDTAKLATNFTQLGADVKSFYDIPIEEALQKLRSGLAGEQEPLRALGVFMDEDAVKANAWRTGIAKAGEELTVQQKAQSRAAIITKGLATASGNMAKTQGSAANQATKFTGSMSNLATEVGTVFLPALTRGLGLLNEFGSYLGRVFQENKATLQEWAASLTTAFDYVGAAFMDLPGVFNIGQLIITQGLLNIGEIFDSVGQNIVSIAAWIGKNWYELIEDAIVASYDLLKNLAKNFAALGAGLFDFLKDPTQGFKVDWTPMLDGFETTVSEMPALLKPQLTDMSGEIGAAMNKVFGGVGTGKAGGPGAAAGPRGTLAPDMGEPQSIKDLKELTKFADKLKDDLKTPADKFREGMDKLTRAREAGYLTDDQFQKGKAQVAKDSGINQEAKFSGAVELGSKEAYSSVVGAISGRSNGMIDLEKSNQETAKNTATSAAALKVIAQKFNAQEMVYRI